jgi:hypothetical protein
VAKWLTRWSAKPVFEGSIPSRCSIIFLVFGPRYGFYLQGFEGTEGAYVECSCWGRTADPSTALPRIHVDTRGVDDLHAALFTEGRTRVRRWRREVGYPVRSVEK